MRLFLCEKPSQGRDIARFIGANQRGKGFLSGAGVVVTWAFGHLLEIASPEEYGAQFCKPWRMDVLPILPTEWKMIVKKNSAEQFAVISRLLKQADEVIIATDADREGEVLARELLDYCRFTGNVKRLWLSALDDASIRKGLDNLLPGEKTVRLYYAGMGRSKADWLIGMNLTRIYTLKALEQGVDELLSIGRVQTPTLALIVQRDNIIENFTSKPYWQVFTDLEKSGVIFRTQWVPAAGYCDDEKRCVQHNVALAVEQLCKQTSSASVIDISQKRVKTSAPLCFSLSALQKACSDKWGMSAPKVLEIAQSLYEVHKATTYPRTDCGYLPELMKGEVNHVLSAILKSDPSITPLVNEVDSSFVSRIWNDKKISAHHAIIPTKQPFDISKLSDDELNVYQLIRLHYLAQFFPLQESDITDVTFNLGGQLFKTRGSVAVVIGWKKLFSNDKEPDAYFDKNGNEEALPILHTNDICNVSTCEVKEQQTKPPSRFTDGTLIDAMKNAASFISDPTLKKILRDNAGLGTEATRAGIIDVLFTRNYLKRRDKFIYSTQLARELISQLPEALTNPGMTALWEQALDDVAEGRMSLDAFLQKQKEWTLRLVDRGRQQAIKLTAPVSPSCPQCGGVMRKRNSDNGAFWGCAKYPLCKGIVGEGVKKTKRGKKNLKTRSKPAT
ncbi:DNA topoisomerase III [Pectobacterium cacticida]|uniref:DNA topoisomerase n=1 Tax=Pectobacterium cacticida TaxID=69221 RepID=A0ABZ2GFT0_9GAMM|nr:DNA topoisomerase III [Pectobacterium cacticida]UYX08612.1 DNA topoisomerase III [Pectobacterium cacticida]